MCECVEIKPQSEECYAQMIIVEIPSHMKEYKDSREKAGLSSLVSIDPCIYEEICFLWEKGVITYGSCCGHNVVESMVNVSSRSIKLMVELGYQANHNNPNREDTFRLKSA